MLITAYDDPASACYSAGKEFIIIRIATHRFGKIFGIVQLCLNSYQIKNRLQVN